MRYIRKKNLWKGEVLLCRPEVHWVFALKPLLVVLLLFLIFPILYWLIGSLTPYYQDMALNFHILKYSFFGVIVVMVIYSIRRILSLLNIEYGITNRRIIMKKGIFNICVTEVSMDRIESIRCYKSLLGRLFNYGSVFISGVGGTTSFFFVVHKPFMVRKVITEIIERNKAVTVLQGLPPPPAPLPPSKEKPSESSLYGTFVRMLPPDDNNTKG